MDDKAFNDIYAKMMHDRWNARMVQEDIQSQRQGEDARTSIARNMSGLTNYAKRLNMKVDQNPNDRGVVEELTSFAAFLRKQTNWASEFTDPVNEAVITEAVDVLAKIKAAGGDILTAFPNAQRVFWDRSAHPTPYALPKQATSFSDKGDGFLVDGGYVIPRGITGRMRAYDFPDTEVINNTGDAILNPANLTSFTPPVVRNGRVVSKGRVVYGGDNTEEAKPEESSRTKTCPTCGGTGRVPV